MPELLYGGIDAGGTSTRCVVADAGGNILGAGRAGPGNSLLVGRAAALASYAEAVRSATTGLAERPLRLHIAAAGTLVPEEATGLAEYVTSGNDAPSAFAGALVHGPGMIVIAGTGSALYGEGLRGNSILIGGWGPLAGDEGSGYAIGRDALRLLGKTIDKRAEAGVLTTSLQQTLGTYERAALQRRLYDPPMPREEVAALSGAVAEAAAAGDTAAGAILDSAARDLAETVADGAKLLDLSREHVRVATLGGVWKAGELVLSAFRRHLNALSPGARIEPARFPPVVGAVLIAYRQAAIEVSPATLAALTDGLERWGL